MLKIYLNHDTAAELDLSDYILDITPLSRKVESGKPGEPGVISYDVVSLEFPLSAFPNDEFSFVNLDSNGRYLIDIEIFNTRIFKGVVDKDSVIHSAKETVKFNVLDRIKALEELDDSQPRPLMTKDAGSGYEYFIWTDGTADDEFEIYRRLSSDHSGVNYGDSIETGSIIIVDGTQYFVVKAARRWNSNSNVYYQWIKTDSGKPAHLYDFGQTFNYYYYLFYSNNINLYTSTEVSGFDLIKIIRAIITRMWPGVTVYNRTGKPSYEIALSRWPDLVTDTLGKHPLDALIYITATLRIYLYVGKDGNFYLQAVNEIGNYESLDISSYNPLDYEKIYRWDKKIDYVLVKDAEQEYDPDNSATYGEYPVSLNIIPRNKLERTAFNFNNDLDAIAQDLYNFYGVWKTAWQLKLKLDSDNLNLDLTWKIIWDSAEWFAESIIFELIELELGIKLVKL